MSEPKEKDKDLYNYKATIERIIDADTVVANISVGFNIYNVVKLRLLGINAPEKNTVEGKDAIKWLSENLPIGEEVKISTYKDSTDKFGRILAIVTYLDMDMNQELIKSGHAVEYWGGKR